MVDAVKKEVASIYDYYPLYSLIYSRSKRYKKSEAGGAMFAMRTLAEWNNRTGTLDLARVGFNVLEILAGEGDHQQFVANPEPYKITSYHNLDIRPQDNVDGKNFIVGNALTYRANPAMNLNFIVGFFFSASTITDQYGHHSRAILVDLFKNVRTNLAFGGGFLIDFNPNGYSASINTLESANTHYQVQIPAGDSQLRKDFGLTADAPAIISYFRGTEYDRMMSTCYDIFATPFEVWSDGVMVGEIKVNDPLTQRYFSETELVDIAQEAGFTELRWFRFTNPKGTYQALPVRFSVSSDIVDTQGGQLMANTLLCIHK